MELKNEACQNTSGFLNNVVHKNTRKPNSSGKRVLFRAAVYRLMDVHKSLYFKDFKDFSTTYSLLKSDTVRSCL